jgi:hypothetical protein
MKSQLLDNLARAIDAPREPGRLERIKEAFAEYTEELNRGKPPWYRRMWSYGSNNNTP